MFTLKNKKDLQSTIYNLGNEKKRNKLNPKLAEEGSNDQSRDKIENRKTIEKINKTKS